MGTARPGERPAHCAAPPARRLHAAARLRPVMSVTRALRACPPTAREGRDLPLWVSSQNAFSSARRPALHVSRIQDHDRRRTLARASCLGSSSRRSKCRSARARSASWMRPKSGDTSRRPLPRLHLQPRPPITIARTKLLPHVFLPEISRGSRFAEATGAEPPATDYPGGSRTAPSSRIVSPLR
jgi:hypothetical protein